MSILGSDIPNGPPNLHLNCLLTVKHRIQHRARILLCWDWFSLLLGRGRNGRTPFVMEKDQHCNIARIVLREESCVQEQHWKAFPKDQSWSLPHPWKSILKLRTIKMEWQLTCCFPQLFSSACSLLLLLLLCLLQNTQFHYQGYEALALQIVW